MQILAEQDKLLEAHLADALSLDQLGKFQTRLRAELDGIEAQIADHHNDYQGARALIDGALDLARDFARVYERCDEQYKRLANQTFFTRIYLGEGDTIRRHGRTLRHDPRRDHEAAGHHLGRSTHVHQRRERCCNPRPVSSGPDYNIAH